MIKTIYWQKCSKSVKAGAGQQQFITQRAPVRANKSAKCLFSSALFGQRNLLKSAHQVTKKITRVAWADCSCIDPVLVTPSECCDTVTTPLRYIFLGSRYSPKTRTSFINSPFNRGALPDQIVCFFKHCSKGGGGDHV